jgi:hypothetical protein
MGAGGEALFANIPTWTSGMAVREGGGFKTDSPNARNQLIGCYTEGGQAPSQLIAPTLVIGGLWGADIVNTDPAKDMATILAGDGTSKFPLKAEFSDLRTGPLGLMVNGHKVVGTQGTSLPADATDLASALALINSIKARLVAHGLVAK